MLNWLSSMKDLATCQLIGKQAAVNIGSATGNWQVLISLYTRNLSSQVPKKKENGWMDKRVGGKETFSANQYLDSDVKYQSDVSSFDTFKRKGDSPFCSFCMCKVRIIVYKSF